MKVNVIDEGGGGDGEWNYSIVFIEYYTKKGLLYLN